MIRIHQALHGYAQGHRELACSIKLPPADAYEVLFMSDAPSTGVASGVDSYLTGYTLPEAGLYALARTWQALEMPRPGCVWTHTLFIEFADLAQVREPSQLALLFRRPSSSAVLQDYDSTLQFMPSAAPLDMYFDANETRWLGGTLMTLYGAPSERILAVRTPNLDVDRLVLCAWDQQWPRLRRSFRFCTSSTKDRSNKGKPFDLQLISESDASMRSRFAGMLLSSELPQVDLDSAQIPGWLDAILADLRKPNASGLRDTLRTLGADILGGREGMAALCEFHRVMAAMHEPQVLHRAMALLQAGPLHGSEIARTRVANEVLRRVEQLGNHGLRFLWTEWRLMDAVELEERLPIVAQLLWQNFASLVLQALQEQDDTADFADRILQVLPLQAVLDTWSELGDSKWELLKKRPDLAQSSTFWRLANARPADLGELDVRSPAVLGAMMQGLQNSDLDLIGWTVREAGTNAVLASLQRLLKRGENLDGAVWVSHACQDVGALALFLDAQGPIDQMLLETIGRAGGVDTTPNDYGDDPWLTALVAARVADGRLTLAVAALGFRRALGWRSRSVAPLLQMTFDPLHAAAVASQIDDATWALVEDKLPWVSHGESWDRSRRLRMTVAREFVERKLWPRAFAWMSDRDDVFFALMEEVLQKFSGARFLRAVEADLLEEYAMQAQTNLAIERRLELIRSFLGRKARKG